MTGKYWLLFLGTTLLTAAPFGIAQTDNRDNAPNFFIQQEKNEKQCENLVKQIHYDIDTYPDKDGTQYLPWMSLSWLQTQLGHEHTATIRDYVYIWKNFNMFMGADGSIEKMGTLPHHLQPKTLEDVIGILGQPQKVVSEQLNLHHWSCPTNTQSYIAMLTSKESASLGIFGRDCSKTACETFFSAYGQSKLKHNFMEQLQQQTQINLNFLAVRLKNYNDYFKTTLQNQTQLTEDITAKIKNYYANLRQCKPGIYQYAVPVLQDYLYETSTIHKQENDACIVQTSYKIPNIGKLDLKCKFSLQNLPLFSDTEAEAAARGFSDPDSELQKMTKNECKRYVGGTL